VTLPRAHVIRTVRWAANVLGYVGETTRGAQVTQVEGLPLGDEIGRDASSAPTSNGLRGSLGGRSSKSTRGGTVCRRSRSRTRLVRRRRHVVDPTRTCNASPEESIQVRHVACPSTERSTGHRRSFLGAGRPRPFVRDAKTGEVVALGQRADLRSAKFVGGVTRTTSSSSTTRRISSLCRPGDGAAYPLGRRQRRHGVRRAGSGNGVAGRWLSVYVLSSCSATARSRIGSSPTRTISLGRRSSVRAHRCSYRFACELGGGRISRCCKRGQPTKESCSLLARRFGLGNPSTIDLPDEAGGRMPERQWKRTCGKESKEQWCKLGGSNAVYADLCRTDTHGGAVTR